ncbi:uncharacterized protein LOC105836434 isoform X1 [Monomorium pharaonis]|uniref:uncharacterized protein LOC105836434 isoform X1 n=1 Tax=Monomorium pharaonis TaxID=307658 RepID=UPI00063F0AD8|nr:uncharacterized protein LOC105836434 isoform X1 [Monomorium pharaonis]
MRCAELQIGKRPHLTVRKGVENVAANDKVNKNDSSARDQGQVIAGHSTPVMRKPRANADDSPDFDYSPSPILPPCTQEGGNEVAWDWQGSLGRSPESRSRKQRVECETPKRTKLLQRKRNSNSPLLYKSRKRKTIKMENIQNIGQFSAELQALIEQMRVIKENDKDHSSDCVVKKEETTSTSLKTDTSGGEKTSELEDDKWNRSVEKGGNKCDGSVEETNDNVGKKEASGNYDDLFDDSVDEDMIRCTQEIEEKFSLMDKGNSAHSQVNREGPEVVATVKTPVQSNSSEDFKNSLIRNVLGTGDDGNNTLKTYSRLSLKRDMNSSVNFAIPRSKDSHKPCPNNNNMIHSPNIQVKKPCENKKLPKSNTVELFDFLDDSFDDWFAACDEKLFPEFNESSVREDDGTAKLQTSYKSLTNAPLKSMEASKSIEPAAAKPETSNVFANRKFFKTKSLSEQSMNRGASTIAKGRINSSYYVAKPIHPNSSKGTHTSVARTPVSTKPIVTNERKIENNIISLIHDVDRTHGFGVNRCAVKSDANRFVKHHSTDSMINDRKGQEMTKTVSQPTRCTAEEIERKRLQALARLEAKRKLFSNNVINNINR